VYGEGQLGEVEGRIYTGWNEIEKIPHEARLERFGLDFGYSTDPTAIVAIYRYNNGLIMDEVAYLKGLSNKRIADLILAQPQQALVIADSAEPKSIDEIASYGISIAPAAKGADSVRQGIQVVQDQRISYTTRSHNLIKEYRNYLWRKDRDGKTISPNVPEEGFDHLNDALRYAITDMMKNPEIEDEEIWGDYAFKGI
jgi:phage terminase large subunit